MKTARVVALLLALLLPGAVLAQSDPGTDEFGVGPSEVAFGSIVPIITESGFISLSVDGLGMTGSTGALQVNKPAGATVRSAYLAAASTGFSRRQLVNGDVRLVGVPVTWNISTPSSISSWNHWADVTSIVQPVVDSALTGVVSLTVTENGSSGIDGEILAVIFDDPSNQTTRNTIVLLFGAQTITGDTFAISLAEPIDVDDPAVQLEMSLGISFGFQPSTQSSFVVVNGTQMTSSAGGQDDGQPANGALLTVGGIGDTPTNPAPNAGPNVNPTFDDELYDLLPFVQDGDTNISVFTHNPSRDDNIFFAALNLVSAVAIVGEGVVLSPIFATNEAGTNHTVTASVQDDLGNPVVGRTVDFEIISGPNTGETGTDVTDAAGEATFTYLGDIAVGVDEIQASFVTSRGTTAFSNIALKEWIITNQPPVCDAGNPDAEECAGTTTSVQLDGTGSSDPDGDTLTYLWTSNCPGASFDDPTSPTPVLTVDTSGLCPSGLSCNVELTVDDGNGATSSCQATVSVADTTPPVITLNGDAEVTIECHVGSYAEDGATANDTCNGSFAATIGGDTVDANTPGTYVVTYDASDACGNPATQATRTVNVIDTTPPVVTGVSVAGRFRMLGDEIPGVWPPNHQMWDVDLTANVTDLCDSAAGITTAVTVYCDEDDEDPTGDGTHSPDARDIATGTLRLRAERHGDRDGRVYLIVVSATDSSGNTGFSACTVVVPHSLNNGGITGVVSQANAARGAFLFGPTRGTIPSGFVPCGDGAVIGPHQ